MHILVVSAWLPEQDWLRTTVCLAARKIHPEKLPQNFSGAEQKAGPFWLEDCKISFLLCGIGPIRAAAAVAAEIQKVSTASVPYNQICFLGTCGSYNSKMFPLNCVVSSTHVLVSDGAAVCGDAYFPNSRKKYAEEFFSSREQQLLPLTPSAVELPCSVAAFKATKVPSAPNVVYPHIVTALNPPSITTSSELAKQFAQHAEVENLEIAGVAVASEQAGLPWCSVLGVSNEVGQLAHEQWKSHHKSASLAAQKSLARSLHLSD